MYQLILLIPIGIDLQYFDEQWPFFLELAEQMPGLIRESIVRIDQTLFGQTSLQRIYTFSFENQQDLKEALLSPFGEKAGNMLHDLTGGKITILTAESQEDTLSNIQSFKAQEVE